MSQNESTESYHKRLQELERTVQELESKIARLDREKAVFSAKSRLYADELNRSHRREMAQESLVAELVERQHELNVMLNRSNVMLARAHEATAMLSVEFGELARALPEPLALDAEAPEMEQIEDRLQRINSLFKKTGSLSAEIAETLHRNAAATDAASADAARTTPAPRPEPKEAAAPQARVTCTRGGSSRSPLRATPICSQCGGTSSGTPFEPALGAARTRGVGAASGAVSTGHDRPGSCSVTVPCRGRRTGSTG
mgnify:CR=1 FL=1